MPVAGKQYNDSQAWQLTQGSYGARRGARYICRPNQLLQISVVTASHFVRRRRIVRACFASDRDRYDGVEGQYLDDEVRIFSDFLEEADGGGSQR